MNVRVRILFESPDKETEQAMRLLAGGLTNDAGSVRVFSDANPGWLVAEFTMPTEAQYAAVPKIDRAIRFWASDRMDSSIEFPKSEAERARADRKATRCRAKRHGRKAT